MSFKDAVRCTPTISKPDLNSCIKRAIILTPSACKHYSFIVVGIILVSRFVDWYNRPLYNDFVVYPAIILTHILTKQGFVSKNRSLKPQSDPGLLPLLQELKAFKISASVMCLSKSCTSILTSDKLEKSIFLPSLRLFKILLGFTNGKITSC